MLYARDLLVPGLASPWACLHSSLDYISRSDTYPVPATRPDGRICYGCLSSLWCG